MPLNARQLYTQIAEKASEQAGKDLSCEDIKRALAGMLTVVTDQLNSEGTAKIPGFLTVRVKRTAARAAGTRKMFGKETACAVKPVTARLRIRALKQLRTAIKL